MGWLTEHITALVLAASLLSNVGLDAEVDKSEVLDRIGGCVDSSNKSEAYAVIDVVAHFLELEPQSGEREEAWLNKIAIVAKG